MTFTFRGVTIENPCMDETGRFPVDPVEHYARNTSVRGILSQLRNTYHGDINVYEVTDSHASFSWELPVWNAEIMVSRLTGQVWTRSDADEGWIVENWRAKL